MKKQITPWLTLLCCCLLLPFLAAQNGLPAYAGTRGRALGGSGVAFTGAHAAWTNPAGLGRLDRLGVNLSGEQRFGLSELQQLTLGAAIPAKLGGFGLTLTSFGYSTLRENRIGISYGRTLAQNFRLGAELIGWNASIEGYDSQFAATFSIGVQVDVLPELTLGFRALSPLRVATAGDEILPQLFTVGLGYQASKKVLILAEVQQDLDFPARFRAGLEYTVSEAFDLRFGVASGPAEMSFGAGYLATDQIRIEVVAAYHETLGLTPGVGIVYAAEK